jgi:hypothetical protein
MTEGSQCADILQYMAGGNSLTALEALQRFGCLRLAARIQDLEALGHTFDVEMVEQNGKRYASYTLVPRVTDRDLENAGQLAMFG